ncbi:glycosyltransferase family 2 protein [Campylobacter sp. Marseille-Q3452]|uniref:Glycosyltransferase family 2 protein n=1 Tax=Campylobacter massiliensis TaxID=2762557 RepID=A0A842J704_9BACT|nr:glycosyltransferase family 2 protein [Campylobacter massiliensis]MBC2883461.1 glycosyltransferase family 2 protein [Campylobacter massiliensis]
MNKFAFLVPFYNHPQNIKALIAALKTYELPVIVVDDGSDEASKQILAELERTEGILLLTRAQNGGKGIAMKEGFKFALERGFSHVLQIDADFQHDAALIGEFLRESRAHPQSIVCANPIYGDDAPKSRVYGRKITNFWVAINTLSLGVKDAMCGFRVYPLEQLKKAAAKSKTNRMEFDIEILVNAVRQGIDVRWIDTCVCYEKGGVSHFKMLRDNALISLMHAKCFFSLPKFALSKIWRACGLNLSEKTHVEPRKFDEANKANDAQNLKKSQENAEQNLWWKKQERGGAFFLRLSLFLAQILPEFALKLIVKIVVWFYYIFSKNERENIAAFRRNLSEFAGAQTLKKTSVFSHFEAFGGAICDKFRVWKGKIKDDELEIIDLEHIKSELIGAQKGQILLTAHLGNVEICKALGARVDGFRMVILAYDKNSREFNEVLKQISQSDGSVRMMLVNELDVAAMLELKNIVESGAHIGIMGDRTPLGGDKAACVKFLGKEASFNYGPYLIAGILGVKISSLWCQKIGGKFRIELVPLASAVKLGRDKTAAAREYLQIYVRELENRCKQTPTQWFNFFDFWR